MGFPGVQWYRICLPMQEMQQMHLRSLGIKMATCFSIPAWKIPWTEKPGRATIHGVKKSQTQLSARAHIHTQTSNSIRKSQYKEMATHSSVLAWRIPGTEEPSGLPSMGSHRVGHD